jgi:hypothetical protein
MSCNHELLFLLEKLTKAAKILAGVLSLGFSTPFDAIFD